VPLQGTAIDVVDGAVELLRAAVSERLRCAALLSVIVCIIALTQTGSAIRGFSSSPRAPEHSPEIALDPHDEQGSAHPVDHENGHHADAPNVARRRSTAPLSDYHGVLGHEHTDPNGNSYSAPPFARDVLRSDATSGNTLTVPDGDASDSYNNLDILPLSSRTAGGSDAPPGGALTIGDPPVTELLAQSAGDLLQPNFAGVEYDSAIIDEVALPESYDWSLVADWLPGDGLSQAPSQDDVLSEDEVLLQVVDTSDVNEVSFLCDFAQLTAHNCPDDLMTDSLYQPTTLATPHVVPEPSTWALSCVGIAALAGWRIVRSRRQNESASERPINGHS
jgi:hypothetical protein